MRRSLAIVLFFLAAPFLPSAEPPPPADSASVAARADALLKQFTLEEKIKYLGGDDHFSIRAMPRLKIPKIKMADGPMGCRGNLQSNPSTGYGAGVALAATWDPEMARKLGASMGRDCRARGFNILLAPGVNISRSPLCGRNFEYMGEDPFLAGHMAAGVLQGLQSEGVLGCVKHFAANNQEWDRNHISSEVDERTLREIYLPAFEYAVKQGKAPTVMAAYNLLNGTYCTANDWLLNQVLKEEWGFNGFVMSDWGALHDARGAALGGCDLEMPWAEHFTQKTLLPLVQNGTVPEAVIDDKVRRILTTIIAAGFLDRPQKRTDIPLDDPQSDAVALVGARASTVLLKNDHNLLPLTLNAAQTILVVGPNAQPAVSGGAGSGHVTTFHAVSVLDAIKASAPQATVLYHPGLQKISGVVQGQDTLDQAAKSADIIIACVGFGQSADTNSYHAPYQAGWPSADARSRHMIEAEDSDRPFELPKVQVDMLQSLAALHKKMIVVLNAGAGVDPAGWLDQVPALLCAWYPGQEGGTAVADIISGAVNPSAKLPVTFGRRFEDYPCAPYYHIKNQGKTPYTEGINVGYRGFDAGKIDPLFCFGFGLSYATFAYDNLKIEPAGNGQVKVSFSIKNTGTRPGSEIAQVYVTPAPAPVSRPPQELKGFAKIELQPGEIRPVEVLLDSRAFSWWDTQKEAWTVTPGSYGIEVAASSRDIRLTGSVTR